MSSHPPRRKSDVSWSLFCLLFGAVVAWLTIAEQSTHRFEGTILDKGGMALMWATAVAALVLAVAGGGSLFGLPWGRSAMVIANTVAAALSLLVGVFFMVVATAFDWHLLGVIVLVFGFATAAFFGLIARGFRSRASTLRIRRVLPPKGDG